MPTASHPCPLRICNHAPKCVASTTFRTLRVSVFKGRFRPLKKFEKFSTFHNVEMDKHLEVGARPFPHCGKWKVGKFGKHAPAVATLVHSPLPITARENKDRSAQSVQDQASLSPAATRAGFSSPPRPQISITHGIRSVILGHD